MRSDMALYTYRSHFKPSRQLAAPHAMVGVNVIAADTDAQAQRLATTLQMGFTDIFRNARGLSKPPIDDIDSYWTRKEKADVTRMLECSVIGSPETVRSGLEALVKRTRADELMIVSDIFDHAARLRSFDLLSAAVGAVPVTR